MHIDVVQIDNWHGRLTSMTCVYYMDVFLFQEPVILKFAFGICSKEK